MNWLDQFLNTELYQGRTLGDLLTLDFLTTVVGSVLAAIAIIVVGVTLAGFFARKVRRIGRESRADRTLFNFLGNVVRYTIWAFTALIVLNTFGVQTTSIVAAVGAAGLAIGLALQGTLSNLAAGIMLILFRPFKTGDFVDINGVMGTVKEITLNYTEIANLGNVQVLVPNSEVWANTITNYSTNDERRAEWTFGVGYGANLADAERIIRDTILSDPRALEEPAPFIQVNNLGDSSVDFLVRVWCKSGDYFQFQADMKRAVKEAMDEGGIDIPFPTQTLVHENQPIRLRAAPTTEDQVAAE